MGEHGQRFGPAADLLDEACGEFAFDEQPDLLRGSDDHFAQFVGGQGAEHEPGAAQFVGQAPVFAAAGVEVGAYGEQDAQPAVRVAGGQQEVDEPGAFGGVPAEGEDLFELVDDDPAVGFVVGGGEEVGVGGGRPGSGGEDPEDGGAAVGGGLVAQVGDEAGAQQGGLAAAGGAEQDGEAVFAHEPSEFAHGPVAAEEEVLVAGLVAGQSPVGGGRVPVGFAHGLAELFPGGLPEGFQECGVASAGAGVALDDRPGGEAFAGGRLGEGRRGEAGLFRHGPVGRSAGGPPQFAQFVREPLDGTGLGVHGEFGAACHMSCLHRAVRDGGSLPG
nr:hypothetical protein [Streptomyces sp. ST1015]